MNFQVNNNGDTADTMVTQYRDVMDDCRRLIDTLSHARPHARNYQTLPDSMGPFLADENQWKDMMVQVNQLHDTAQDAALRAMDQGK